MPDKTKLSRVSIRDAALVVLGRCITVLVLACWLVAPLASALASDWAAPEREMVSMHSHDMLDSEKAPALADHGMVATGDDDCTKGDEAIACVQMCLSHCNLAIAAPLPPHNSPTYLRLKLAGDQRGFSLLPEPIVPPPRLHS